MGLSNPSGALTPSSSTDIFIAPGVGTTVNRQTAPVSSYSLAVTADGAVNGWTVILEVSHDGIKWTRALTHTNATGDGVMIWNVDPLPALFHRTNCAALTLGTGVNIVATVVAR